MMKHKRTIGVIVILAAVLSSCTTIERDWQKATQLNSLEIYNRFLRKHPQSEFANAAQTRIAELEQSDWRKTTDLNTVKDYKVFLRKYPNGKFTALAEVRIQDLVNSATCRERKELFLIIQEDLSKETREKLENLYGNCIRANHFCEYCGEPAVGWCHMRNKYVCETHRFFTQGGTRWRCP